MYERPKHHIWRVHVWIKALAAGAVMARCRGQEVDEQPPSENIKMSWSVVTEQDRNATNTVLGEAQ
jgi:hypothetical protein